MRAQWVVVPFTECGKVGRGVLEDSWESKVCLKWDLEKGMDINFLLVQSGSNLRSTEKTGCGLEK